MIIELDKGNNERKSPATNYCDFPNPSLTPNDIPSLRFSTYIYEALKSLRCVFQTKQHAQKLK